MRRTRSRMDKGARQEDDNERQLRRRSGSGRDNFTYRRRSGEVQSDMGRIEKGQTSLHALLQELPKNTTTSQDKSHRCIRCYYEGKVSQSTPQSKPTKSEDGKICYMKALFELIKEKHRAVLLKNSTYHSDILDEAGLQHICDHHFLLKGTENTVHFTNIGIIELRGSFDAYRIISGVVDDVGWLDRTYAQWDVTWDWTSL